MVLRDAGGDPVVIRNAPLLDDGTPMPTLFWLVGRSESLAVDRLEAGGGVRRAEAAVEPSALADAHKRYAALRDSALPPGWSGARPSGGVGGARRGVKCLHAHYAWFLAGGDDPVGKWVACELGAPAAGAPSDRPGAAPVAGAQSDRPGAAPVAAVDIGTNSTRLLVACPHGPIVERLNRITRLGQGVDRTRRLAPAAVERTLSVLLEYRKVMDRRGATRVRVTATSAARDATNREGFFDAAETVIGARPELLAGEEEARLSFVGATSDLDRESSPWLIADIGGGSTELASGPAPGGGPLAVRSLDVGCVRLSERFLRADPPTRAELDSARSYVAGLFHEAAQSDPALRGARTLVGLAGTVSCLASVDQSLGSYDRSRIHHHVLGLHRVRELVEVLAGMTIAARRQVPGVEPERADVIVGGAVVLEQLMMSLGFEECLSSESDILDGLVLSLAEEPQTSSGRAP